jgi:hypothetical protein
MLMKITELFATYSMNFRICCELVLIVDCKKQYRKYILRGKGNIFNVRISVYTILSF